MGEVWDAWTTEQGVTSFFAPAGNVELCVNGRYEILFNPDAGPGQRGAEGTRVLAFQVKKMLAFTWNAPPHPPSLHRPKEQPPSHSTEATGHDADLRQGTVAR